jgi:hypothetical protein
MGYFFKDIVRKKSTKPFIIIKMLVSITFIFLLVMGVFNDYNFYFVWAFALLGVGSFIDGFESYFQKEDRWLYLMDFGVGVILFILAFQFSY